MQLQNSRSSHIMWHNLRSNKVGISGGIDTHTHIIYLCTVLGLGHSYQELEYGLRLRHQRRDGVDDRCELRVRFHTWNTTDTQQMFKCIWTNPVNSFGWNIASSLSAVDAISGSLKRIKPAENWSPSFPNTSCLFWTKGVSCNESVRSSKIWMI